MDYFLLAQNERIPNRVRPSGLGVTFRGNFNCDPLTPVQVSVGNPEPPEYVDFIERPAPLVSDRLKMLWQVYEKKAVFAPVVLADHSRGTLQLYWSVILSKLPCLSTEAEFRKDTTLKKLVMNPKATAGARLFQVDGIIENYIIVNLLVLESMLRRNFTGFTFARVPQDPPEHGLPHSG